jgi:HSP20 family protein
MAKERAKEQPRSPEGRESGGEERGVGRRERETRPGFASSNPFTLMRRFIDDMDRLFEGFAGPGAMGLLPRIDVGEGAEGREGMWVPPVEVMEREGQLVVRADMPGLSKDQIHVDVEEGQLVISGERRREHEERRGGLYRSERSYGTFYRAIPLPEGIDPAQAKAIFKDGVLEVTMPAPQRSSGRRIEIQEGTETASARKAETKSA